MSRSSLPPDLYGKYRAALLSYLRSTHDKLESGATALDSVVHAVSLMEDDPLFNCGRGSVFTTVGTIEMEASVMVTTLRDESKQPGSIKRGAGVMGVKNVRHPIQLARECLMRCGYDELGNANHDGGNMHSQLTGPFVEGLARDWDLEFKPDEWFFTTARWEEHLRGLREEEENITMSQGTVGCVCLDQWGNLAVATSTGGMTNKTPGRIGDTPTLGAGFFAETWEEVAEDNSQKKKRGIAVSGTGNGDSVIRTAAARTACAVLRFSSTSTLAEAVTAVAGPQGELQRSAGKRWEKTGEGECGIIGVEAEMDVDKWESPIVSAAGQKLLRGRVVFDFNCGGMFRAWIDEQDVERFMVFRDE